MKRFGRILMAPLRVLGTFIRWAWRQVRWVAAQVGRLVGGILSQAFDWIVRGLRAVKTKVEGAIDWLLDVVARAFRRADHGERVREERVGANGAPLLATIVLAFVWYLLPTARLPAYGPGRFVLGGFVIWLVSLVVWLDRCRSDRRGRVARFVQQVARSTGLRRLDQFMLVLGLLMVWLTTKDIEVLPLALGTVVAAFGLLTIEHQLRPELAAPRLPSFTVSDETPPVVPSGRFIDRELTWTVHAHGQAHHHRAVVRIDEVALEHARETNPGSGSVEELVEWVQHGVGAEIDSVAQQIHQICFDGAYSLLATVSCFVAASQSVSYVSDLESTGSEEYWRYPIETLADGVGDCEDSAILLAALLRRAGFRCAMVLVPGHAAVAVEVPNDTPGIYFVRDDVRYYYCETTDAGWRVGQAPAEVDMDSAVFLPVPEWEPQP